MATTPNMPPNVNKRRDFMIGFFGWLVIWNLLGIFFGFVPILEYICLVLPVLPFFIGKKWIGFGALSYVIANTIVISLLFGEFDLYGLTTPFATLFLLQ